MFCQKCGKEIAENTNFCPYCGNKASSVSASENNNAGTKVNNTVQNSQYNVSKSGMGVLLCILLGLIGLIIGVCIYPAGTLARQTFLKGFWITLAVLAGIAVLVFILIAATAPIAYGGSPYR